jgi:hypothetical protein
VEQLTCSMQLLGLVPMHSDSQQFVGAAGWFETLTEVTRRFLAQGGLVWQRAASVPGMKESGPIHTDQPTGHSL